MPNITVSNYSSLASLLEIAKERGVKPEDASIEVFTYDEYNSYGDKFVEIEVTLCVPDNNPSKKKK